MASSSWLSALTRKWRQHEPALAQSVALRQRYGTLPLLRTGKACSASLVAALTYCSNASRPFAYRRRTQGEPAAVATVPARRVSTTVYECESCEVRSWVSSGIPTAGTSLAGLGGPCPNCDDLVVVSDVVNDQTEVSIK